MMEKNKLGKQFHFDNEFWDAPMPCGIIDLYQLGEISFEYGYVIEEHEQYVNEITYVISGSGYSYIDGEEIQLKEGDVLTCAMGRRHSIRASDTDILRFAYIGFRFRSAPDSPDMELLQNCYRQSYTLARDQNDLMFPLIRAINELYAKTDFWPVMLRGYCEQIVIQAARDSRVVHNSPMATDRTNRSVSAEVYKIIQYVDKNIETIGGLREIAHAMGYNYTYLSHVFSRVTGVTLQKYISQKKIERARQLLRYGDFTVTKVAEMLNYESLQSFSKAFRRVMGVTPTVYIQMEKEEDRTIEEKKYEEESEAHRE